MSRSNSNPSFCQGLEYFFRAVQGEWVDDIHSNAQCILSQCRFTFFYEHHQNHALSSVSLYTFFVSFLGCTHSSFSILSLPPLRWST